MAASPRVNGDEFSSDSFPKHKIKILLLENIHQTGIDILQREGFQVESLSTSLSEEELVERIKDVHCLGIRSGTRVTERVLQAGRCLLAVGCFCIGTNQVDLEAAEALGIPVFNSPFCNSRSVAEMIIGQIIGLARQLGDRNREMHAGLWNKTSKGCHEVRHKVLGIVGYGHIGSQLSVLAEAMGMRVIFYDVQKVMPLGNSKAMPDLESLLCRADFVSLHVPLSPSTENMIGAAQLAQMKRGAFLLNASRGNVVVLEDLAAALRSGHLGGAYLDVFPEEPTRNGSWRCELAGMPNVLLTPHVAGSTEEAQAAIAEEVAGRFVRLIDLGDTAGAVNFAQVSAPKVPNAHRILNTHRNVPGVLRDLNKALENHNILQQCLATTRNTGYCVIDVDKSVSHQLRDAIAALPNSIKTRILY